MTPNDDATRPPDAFRVVVSADLTPQPLVSVLMLAYNHGPFLAEAVEGVVRQQCDFPVELIIGDDASTDDTLAVATACQHRYAQLIRVVGARRNVGGYANIRRIFGFARGEFVAYCEGDDYWCRNDKLARQVALIRSDDALAGVHTDWVKSSYRDGKWVVDWNKSVFRRIPARCLQGDLFREFYYPKLMRTCTLLLRRRAVAEYFGSELAAKPYQFGDVVMRAYLTSKWPIAYLPEVTAVYRLSPGSALRSGRKARLEFLKSSLEFDSDARRFFSDRTDYPAGYRWETAVGLFVKALAARDLPSAVYALKDLRRNFGPAAFTAAAWKSLRMRIPGLARNRPTASSASDER